MVTEPIDQKKERNEKAEGALNQLMICARADCGSCTLVPEPEHWKECVQVFDSCETILRESLGLPERTEGDGDGAKA